MMKTDAKIFMLCYCVHWYVAHIVLCCGALLSALLYTLGGILNSIIQSSAHFVRAFKSSCNILCLFGILNVLYNGMSSANNLISLYIYCNVIYIYQEQNRAKDTALRNTWCNFTNRWFSPINHDLLRATIKKWAQPVSPDPIIVHFI